MSAARYAKAFVAAAFTGAATALTTAVSDGALTREEVAAVAGAALAAGLLVWLTPNKPDPSRPSPDRVVQPDMATGNVRPRLPGDEPREPARPPAHMRDDGHVQLRAVDWATIILLASVVVLIVVGR